LITKKIIDGVWDVPWIFTMDVKSTKVSMHSRNVEVIHTFREGNKLADFLTNNAIHFVGIDTERYFHIHELPKKHKPSFKWKRIKSQI